MKNSYYSMLPDKFVQQLWIIYKYIINHNIPIYYSETGTDCVKILIRITNSKFEICI